MRILRAELEDFRNIARAELSPSPHFTALIGPNGQGKTNTLEAIYLVAGLRPLRSVPRRALIRSGTEKARIHLRIERDGTGLVHDLEVILEGRARTLIKDGKKIDTASFLGTCVAVAFTPDDLSLPKGGPDPRRRFLDRALLNIRPTYLVRAFRYARALKERNRALATGGSDEVLEAYEAVLAAEGAVIVGDRLRYVAELGPRVEAEFRAIASPAPPLRLRYLSTLLEDRGASGGRHGGLEPGTTAPETELADRFRERLIQRRTEERRRRTTTTGPHLDDLEITLAGMPVRERASQGQHRAIVLALKLAEIAHLAERLGESPILLLDDMSSELDPERSLQLFDAVRGRQGQVVLTGTEDPRALVARLGPEDPLAFYDVRSGALARRLA